MNGITVQCKVHFDGASHGRKQMVAGAKPAVPLGHVPRISRLMALAIRFDDLPGWPAATAPGHVGRLLFGRLAGRPVVMLQGRFHLYEGNDPGLVVQPVLLFHALGARIVVLTNAAGGLDPSFGPGTLMVMNDHINLTGRTPLIGRNAEELGPRFNDMTDAWSPRLRARLHAAGQAEGVPLEEGIYVGLTGPSYETPAEVRWLAGLGGHAVGMSTRECIQLRRATIQPALARKLRCAFDLALTQ